jgi:molecular chaperone GrpE
VTEPAAEAPVPSRPAVLDESPAGYESSPAAEDERLRRALADLDNLRKRFDRELARRQAEAEAGSARAWLPVVDDLERALQHAGGGDAALVEGVQAVRDRALEVLARLGYPRFGAAGEPFDPRLHDAVAVVDTTVVAGAADGAVVDVVQPGYGTPDNVLRPAAVVVAKARASG